MKPPVRLFLSSSRADAEVAGRLSDALQRLGIEAWTDVQVSVGTDWGEHLRDAMNKSDAIVFLVTPAALASAYVMSEVGAAIAAGKAVVPVVLADHGLPPELPSPLRRWNFIHAGARDPDEVAADIRERLMQTPASAA